MLRQRQGAVEPPVGPQSVPVLTVPSNHARSLAEAQTHPLVPLCGRVASPALAASAAVSAGRSVPVKGPLTDGAEPDIFDQIPLSA